MKLRIAQGLELPIEAVTQATGILAKRRAGKSYTARRYAEQLYKAGQQIVIVDPKGDWWGIRSSANGKAPGLSVVILGGERGDVPLEVGGGEVVAKLVVEERVSVLLDLSLFRKHEVATFMTAFLENLYRLKAKEQYRTPLNLIIDEADAIMPQKPQPNEARMLGAGEDIVRRGGQRGLGCTLITQRSAVLNKNVLTQIEMLITLRTIAPQDLKAIDAWIEVHGEKDQRDTLMSSLPSLPVGDAWFWSPGWPTANGIFKRVHVLPIETFDSGASPKAGEKRVEPKNLADVDLGALTKKMAATIERAKADDPKELRRKIAELERRIRQGTGATAAPAKAQKPVVDQAAIDRAVAAAVASEQKKLRPVLSRLQRLSTSLTEIPLAIGDLAKLADARAVKLLSALPARAVPPTRPAPPPATRRPAAAAAEYSGDVPLSGTQRRILAALAQFAGLGQDESSRPAVAGYCAISHTTGSFSNNLSALRTAGLIEDVADGKIRLTAEGHAAAGPVDAPVGLEELHRTWAGKLSGTQARMLDVIIAAYPDAISRQLIAETIGVQPDTGSYSNNLSKMRTLGLITDKSKTEVVATELLFPPGLA